MQPVEEIAARKLADLKSRNALRRLTAAPEPAKKRRIGFL
jgi:hypothetical protein